MLKNATAFAATADAISTHVTCKAGDFLKFFFFISPNTSIFALMRNEAIIITFASSKALTVMQLSKSHTLSGLRYSLTNGHNNFYCRCLCIFKIVLSVNTLSVNTLKSFEKRSKISSSVTHPILLNTHVTPFRAERGTYIFRWFQKVPKCSKS